MSTGALTSADIRNLIASALHNDLHTIAEISDATGVMPSVTARHLCAMTKSGLANLDQANAGPTSARYSPTKKLPAPDTLELPLLRARRISIELMAAFFAIPPGAQALAAQGGSHG